MTKWIWYLREQTHITVCDVDCDNNAEIHHKLLAAKC